MIRVHEVRDDAWAPTLSALVREYLLTTWHDGDSTRLTSDELEELAGTARNLANGSIRAWVAVDMQDLLGCVLVRDSGEMARLYVRAAHRRAGIGSLLLAAAREGGAMSAVVDPRNDLGAMFFVHHGWIESRPEAATAS